MLCKYTIGHFAKLGSLFCGCHPFFQFRSPCFIEEVAKAEMVTRGYIRIWFIRHHMQRTSRGVFCHSVRSNSTPRCSFLDQEGFRSCFRVRSTPSAHATESMEWVGGRKTIESSFARMQGDERQIYKQCSLFITRPLGFQAS